MYDLGAGDLMDESNAQCEKSNLLDNSIGRIGDLVDDSSLVARSVCTPARPTLAVALPSAMPTLAVALPSARPMNQGILCGRWM